MKVKIIYADPRKMTQELDYRGLSPNEQQIVDGMNRFGLSVVRTKDGNEYHLIDDKEVNFKKLADLLHELFCENNHTDGCGWYYEESAENCWERFDHMKWLKLAKEHYANHEKLEAEITYLEKLKDYKEYLFQTKQRIVKF